MEGSEMIETERLFSKKLTKKLFKIEKTLISKEKLELTSGPSKVLCVQNGGLGNDVCQDDLLPVFSKFGRVECIIMLPRKPYAFVCFCDISSARAAYFQLNGFTLKEGMEPVPSTILYLLYVVRAPSSVVPSREMPPGLHVLEEYVSPQMEQEMLATFSLCDSMDHGDGGGSEVSGVLKHRQVRHYGYEFKYSINDVDINDPLSDGIPAVCHAPLHKALTSGVVKHFPDQLTVNQYTPGQGIPPHVDTTYAFEDGIMSLSLGSQTVMEFRHPEGRHLSVAIPARSLMVMTGESRYVWSHGITPRKSDIMASQDGGITLVHRGTRVSLTFRKIVMDRQKEAVEETMLPQTEDQALALERQHVQQVYDDIADHFSGTRYRPWPRVVDFLAEAPPLSLLADVGCGNGKCLGVNKQLFEIGSDFSKNLASICHSRGNETCVADVTRLPFRSEAVDVVLCIAVIHHMATKDRRQKAVSEVVRILRPGGRALIYVWAMEQDLENKPSKYIHVNRQKKMEGVDASDATCISGPETSLEDTSVTIANRVISEPLKGSSGTEGDESVENLIDTVKNVTCEEQGISIRRKGELDSPPQANISDENNCASDNASVKKLHVHVNRTQFQEQDMLVPWQLKGKRSDATPLCSEPALTFHRYYHMFRQGELEAVCKRVPRCTVQKSYYDQGNWCVILEKMS